MKYSYYFSSQLRVETITEQQLVLVWAVAKIRNFVTALTGARRDESRSTSDSERTTYTVIVTCRFVDEFVFRFNRKERNN